MILPDLVATIEMKDFEIIRAVLLEPVPSDSEGDLITPTYKKRQPQLLKEVNAPLVYELVMLVQISHRI